MRKAIGENCDVYFTHTTSMSMTNILVSTVCMYNCMHMNPPKKNFIVLFSEQIQYHI